MYDRRIYPCDFVFLRPNPKQMAKTEEYEQVIFKRVFNENREMLERIAYFSVRDKEAAKDIVSSAFLKMWEMRGTLDTGRLLPYIYVAVRNACINWRRDSATHHDIFENIRRREKSAMEFYTKAIESCNPAELYVEDILSICRERLEQLPPLTRLIYIRSRVDGMTYKEIAEALDISVKKVDNSIQSALKELRVALADYLDVFILFALASGFRTVV